MACQVPKQVPRAGAHFMSNKKNNRDNVTFVNDFMTWGSPLNQIFVIDAVNKLAKNVVAQKEQLQELMKDSFVSANSWIQCAEKWLRDYDENYK